MDRQLPGLAMDGIHFHQVPPPGKVFPRRDLHSDDIRDGPGWPMFPGDPLGIQEGQGPGETTMSRGSEAGSRRISGIDGERYCCPGVRHGRGNQKVQSGILHSGSDRDWSGGFLTFRESACTMI